MSWESNGSLRSRSSNRRWFSPGRSCAAVQAGLAWFVLTVASFQPARALEAQWWLPGQIQERDLTHAISDEVERLAHELQGSAVIAPTTVASRESLGDRFRAELQRQRDLLPLDVALRYGCVTINIEVTVVVPIHGPPAQYRRVGEGCGSIDVAAQRWETLDAELIPIVVAHEGYLGHHAFDLARPPPEIRHRSINEAWAFLVERFAVEFGWLEGPHRRMVDLHRLGLFRAALSSDTPGAGEAGQTAAALFALETLVTEQSQGKVVRIEHLISVLDLISNPQGGQILVDALVRYLSKPR